MRKRSCPKCNAPAEIDAMYCDQCRTHLTSHTNQEAATATNEDIPVGDVSKNIKKPKGQWEGWVIGAGAILFLFGTFSCMQASVMGGGSGGVLLSLIGLGAMGSVGLYRWWAHRALAMCKTCPECAEQVKREAKVCKHCHYSFNKEAPAAS